MNDLSWVKGAHTWKFGTNLRFSRIGTYNNSNSFHQPQANGSWVSGVGRRYMPGGLCEGVEAACAALPEVAAGGQATYGDSFIPLLGIISEVTANYNYDRDGNVLPVGEPVRRRFAADEYEFYAQDSWKLGQNLTVTAGLRYSLFSPPYEVNGLQVAPNIKLGDWLETRRALMEQGRSTSEAPLIEFDLAGPKNGKPGYYDWDYNNVAPRLAVAWTPHADGGLAGWLTGNGKLAIRGGYSIVYDRIGSALATNFDREGSFGLSTNLSSPFGQNNEDEASIRFAGLGVIPPSLPDAPPGGFPQVPPSYAGVITSALDGTIRTPYAHAFNVVVGRELGKGYSLEAAYVGRRGRDLLVRRDVAMPAEHHGRRRRLLHRGRAADQRGVRHLAERRSLGLREHRGDPVLGEPVPRRGGLRGPDRDAGDGLRVQLERARLDHRALRRRRVLRSGLQPPRRVRVLLAAVRHARRAEHDGPVGVRRAAAVAAQAVLATATSSTSTTRSATRRTTVRCSRATRRSRTSTTAATPDS